MNCRCTMLPEIPFQYPRCWIVSSDGSSSGRPRSAATLSVSSLLDRFLRRKRTGTHLRAWRTFSILAVGSFPQTYFAAEQQHDVLHFQYPRCWIVSSDSARRRSARRRKDLSVSSLLDRFLRRPTFKRRVLVVSAFSILAVGSFPQTVQGAKRPGQLITLSASSLLDRFLRLGMHLPAWPRPNLSVSSLLDRFLRHFFLPRRFLRLSLSVSSLLDRFLRLGTGENLTRRIFAFSILAVGSFPQTFYKR